MKASSVDAESVPGAAAAGIAATGAAMIAAGIAAGIAVYSAPGSTTGSTTGSAAEDAPRVGHTSRPVLHYGEARGFLARARGLLGRPELPPGCGLMLRGVRAVHGFGMRHGIDLVFLDESGAVVRCCRLAPYRVARCAAAKDILEMRAGEIQRLGLHIGMCPILRPAVDIFKEPCPAQAGPTASGEEHQDRKDRQERPPAWPVLVLAAACVLAASAPRGLAQAAPPAGPAEAGLFHAHRAAVAIDSGRPVSEHSSDDRTLQRLESEAEALYRESAPGAATAELVRLYEALSAVAPDRSSHAWLRIGNIHQRAGAVGAAIDAYRRALQATGAAQLPATDDDSKRKARLNLAALGLELVRQSLAGSALVPSAAVHREQLTVLEGLVREASRAPGHASAATPPVNDASSIPAASDRQAIDEGSSHLRSPPVIERYTASGRRNSLKAARGSLHVDPADGLPAKPLPRPRSRPLQEQLPSVEYLLGDPQRFKQSAEDTVDASRRAASRPGRKPSQKRAIDSAGGGS